MQVDLILSQTDGRPMYVQIIEQIKSLISVGDWPKGHKLPSIREMAVATKVSVITVKRAYQELESEGVIDTQQGKGCFVATTGNLSSKLKEQAMEKHLIEALSIARSLGMSVEALIQKLSNLNESNNRLDQEKNDE